MTKTHQELKFSESNILLSNAVRFALEPCLFHNINTHASKQDFWTDAEHFQPLLQISLIAKRQLFFVAESFSF